MGRGAKVALWLVLGLAACLLPACSSGLQRCIDSGGRWYEGPMTAPPSERHGSCIKPSPDGGKACRDGSECALSLCLCPVKPAAESPTAPLVSGTCATFPPASGSGWHCLVVKGRALQQGIIVD